MTVWNLNRQIERQKESNERLKARNESLDEEVGDLKQGYAAIEERARNELGMIKQDEMFYQVIDEHAPVTTNATSKNENPQVVTQSKKTSNECVGHLLKF